MTTDFTHVSLGQRVVFRTGGAADAVAEEVRRRGAESVLVIAGSHERGPAERVCADVPVAAWFDEVVQHVPVAVAEKARAAAEECGADLLVCVGGGSTTGLAKAVALTSGLPILAVPTTYAGSEATDVWGLTGDRTKRTGTDDRVLPATVVYDATLTTSLPVGLSIASGLNALAHCVDSLWAPRTDPVNQALALEGARALAEALPRIAADGADLVGREQALYGGYLAAAAFASAGSGLHHKICHVLGGTFDLPHAETHAIVLPHVLALNAPHVPELAGRLAVALGGSGSAVDALEALRRRVDAPRALADVGLTEDGVPEAVQRVLAAAPADNPAPVTEEALTGLLTRALRGDAPAADDAAAASAEQAAREQALVEEVVASFDAASSPRLRQVLQSLVRHAHAFVRDVRLTEEEWAAGIAFLTAAGHITDDRRQEFILLSDVLGLSMQTIAVGNRAYGEATEATVFGPFFVENAPAIEQGGDIAGGAAGLPCWVEGSVRDTDGAAIPGARIEVWEADDEGLYDVQHADGRVYGRAHLDSDDAGDYRFWALQPAPYPIPHDGPVGAMLAAVGRSPYRAAHLHFMVSAPGYRTLVTHIFVEGDPQLELGDSVFGVKPSLVKRFERQHPGTPTPDGRDLGGAPWSRTRFDVVLAPAGS